MPRLGVASHREAARIELQNWGLEQTPVVRHHWLAPASIMTGATIIGGGISLALYLSTTPRNPSAFSLLAAIVAASAVLIAYAQWRTMRFELSLDKYYDRLESLNRRLCEWEEARALMSDLDGSGSLNDPETWRQKMYVFQELDTLEYVFEKYRLGLLHPEMALRAVQTFRQRCRWHYFRTAVVRIIAGRLDYSQATRDVVLQIAAFHDNKPGTQSTYEQARPKLGPVPPKTPPAPQGGPV